MTDSPFSLEGRNVLVTGGSRGLGRSMAVALARAGAAVMITSRSGRADECADEIHAMGGRLHVIVYDAAEDRRSTGPVQAAVEQFGRLDVLVNNAGTQRRAPLLEFSVEDWEAVIDVNLTAPFVLARAAAEHMVARGGGKIINLASLLSFQGGMTVPAYTASKHGMAGLTRAMANELASRAVNVNAIVPGYMTTDMNTALQADEQRNRQILARIPAGRWGRGADVGGAAVFLASAASDYVHGQMLVVDGGWLSR